jgi:uncharacterized membrane protein YhaH (DUF805 family)
MTGEDLNGFHLKNFGRNHFWWALQFVLILVASFFVFWGIQLLRWAYTLTNPFSFIISFFASNLIILISGVVLIGVIYRMVSVYKKLNERSD